MTKLPKYIPGDLSQVNKPVSFESNELPKEISDRFDEIEHYWIPLDLTARKQLAEVMVKVKFFISQEIEKARRN